MFLQVSEPRGFGSSVINIGEREALWPTLQPLEKVVLGQQIWHLLLLIPS